MGRPDRADEGFAGAVERGTVLVDVPVEGAEALRALLGDAHDVVVCHGPGIGFLCPVLGETGCRRFERAHGIVFALDLDRPQHRAILLRYRTLAGPNLPIRVRCRPDQARRHAGILGEVEVWEEEPCPADLDRFTRDVRAGPGPTPRRAHAG
ncbi:MAG: hypothetical protein M5U14_09715 [Acidimicrobiia bacterium]|nr:hypothetical protein [Acidimicrobiia bacterium]